MKRGPKSKKEVTILKEEQQYRAGLIAQLSARSAETPYFIELVDELIYQRRILRELKELIATGGIVEISKDRNGTAKIALSVLLREVRETEKAMLLILKDLKITTESVIPEDEEDEL